MYCTILLLFVCSGDRSLKLQNREISRSRTPKCAKLGALGPPLFMCGLHKGQVFSVWGTRKTRTRRFGVRIYILQTMIVHPTYPLEVGVPTTALQQPPDPRARRITRRTTNSSSMRRRLSSPTPTSTSRPKRPKCAACSLTRPRRSRRSTRSVGMLKASPRTCSTRRRTDKRPTWSRRSLGGLQRRANIRDDRCHRLGRHQEEGPKNPLQERLRHHQVP